MDANERLWGGVHVSALQTSFNRYQYPKLISNDEHTILIKLPVVVGRVPECYPSVLNTQDHWDETHVKLPCSEKNVTQNHKRRWEMIREIFANISSSQQLEAAILSYNHRYTEVWNFSTLHSFFEEVLDEEEITTFFETLFPKIVDLALCLPQLITDGIPLLRQGYKHSLSLSQVQISCLLANAFLCTFPHRNWNGKNSEYSDYPDINFNRLFQCKKLNRTKCVHEKLKCIINYFRRVTASAPCGVVTYSRQFVSNHMFPEWLRSSNKVPKLYVSSSGTIEDDGFGLLQVDFANKKVGGGVINTGCVQEEIRFVVCPELILSRLFTQVLGENEALVVTGCERFNRYRGYAQTFEWAGNYVDETPSDEYGRKYCTVVALDALRYQCNPRVQYTPENVLRDLNKAYVGFSWGSNRKKEELCAIATGNWGCGAFAGNPQLKSIIQLLAAGEVGRDLAYFTFGDTQLCNSMANVYEFLSENAITVGRICELLILYNDKKVYESVDLFEFLKKEALNVGKFTLETEHPSKLFSMAKTFKIHPNPKLAMNKERSFFCRTKTNEMSEALEDVENFDLEANSSIRCEDNTNEELLKQDELRKLSNLYERAEPPLRGEDNEFPKQDSFEFLDQFKQRMKNSFMKNPSSKPEKLELIEKLESLEAEISTQLSIDEDEKGKNRERDDDELREIVIEKNSTDRNKENQLGREKENYAKKLHESATNEKIQNGLTREDKIDGRKESVAVNRVTLSQLSARLSKSAPNKSRNSKERPTQKRKISDYFDSLNKKSNNA